METYFQIRYEFDRDAVHTGIRGALAENRAAYICVADGNILTMVHRDAAYRATVAESLFSICDSGWVPLYLKRLYGIERQQYCGAQIFRDIVSAGEYRMAFLGTNDATLADLRSAITEWNPAVADMPFTALPFCTVEDFDYPAIAAALDEQGVDIIWVALGAPKQEQFMQRLRPHLRRGVMLGVGAVFNFYSGHIRRAPSLFVRLHLEFAWRLLTEPRKQFRRCWQIVTALPAIYRREKAHPQVSPDSI